jgi:hypothetical protein
LNNILLEGVFEKRGRFVKNQALRVKNKAGQLKKTEQFVSRKMFPGKRDEHSVK